MSAFERMLRDDPGCDGWAVIREFESVDGIADVVFFEPNSSADWAHMAGIPSRWAYALRLIPYKREFDVSEFAEWSGVTRRYARKMLESYCAHGYCEPSASPKTWIKIRRPQVLSTRIRAVEAKLRDWRRALRQAYRYLDYACQSWVLLDAASVAPAIANVKEFVRLNIGLASLSTQERVVIHFDPHPTLPRSAMRFWQANAELARRLYSV